MSLIYRTEVNFRKNTAKEQRGNLITLWLCADVRRINFSREIISSKKKNTGKGDSKLTQMQTPHNRLLTINNKFPL